MTHPHSRAIWLLYAAGLGLLLSAGCASTAPQTSGPVVILLDGAGWSGSDGGIRAGLKAAGFHGRVQSFRWTSFLGPGPDHLLVEHKRRKAKELADLVRARRRSRPDDGLHLMGLSAGAAVVVFALEELPAGTTVDSVVLFAPSISATCDLSDAMTHVRGCLYATSSPRDGILGGLGVAADGRLAAPAGLYGFRIPSRVKCYDHYTRVVNLNWRSVYTDLGWNGSHTGATGKTFVREVIAPRILSTGPHPLNRPLANPWLTQWRDTQAGTPRQ